MEGLQLGVIRYNVTGKGVTAVDVDSPMGRRAGRKRLAKSGSVLTIVPGKLIGVTTVNAIDRVIRQCVAGMYRSRVKKCSISTTVLACNTQ